MREVYARQRKRGKLKEDVIEAIRSALEEDRNVDALRETVAFSERLFRDIFGEGVGRDMLWRVDQKLGVFYWMMEQSKEYLAHAAAEGASGSAESALKGAECGQNVAETARLVTLISVYFLSVF